MSIIPTLDLKPVAQKQSGDKIVLRTGRAIHLVESEKIDYIEACNYYALIHAEKKTYIVRQTLEEFEKQLESHGFVRIHRSVLININIFTSIERTGNQFQAFTSIGKTFRISRYRHKQVKHRILSRFAA